MADVNVVILIGRLTRDAELKFTNSGMAICKFSIAINTRKKSGDQWVDEAHFFDVVYWGKGGEAVSKYLIKGKQVAVEGELRQNRWEQDGQARSKVEINANNVQLLGGGQAGSSQGSSPQGERNGNTERYEHDAQERSHAEPGRSAAPEMGEAPPRDDFNDDIPF
jgi:single-strand DNA-binding protein